MIHVVEFKLPNIFGRKKKVEETVVKTDEVNVEEVIVDAIGETKKLIEDTNNGIKDTLKFLAPFAATLAVGYVAGYNRGLVRGMIKDVSERIIVINK